MACALEAEASVVDLTQYRLFVGDEKKNTISGVTFSFKVRRNIGKYSTSLNTKMVFSVDFQCYEAN